MRVIIPLVFDKLRQMVLDKAEITVITPSDCRNLSLTISKATCKQISDTTLKRIFGFAANNSTPSLYTLNLLAAYCDFTGWESFCDAYAGQSPSMKEKDGLTIINCVEHLLTKTSHNTLQALKSKSVIPFQHTIPRELIGTHLDFFLSSDYRATVLASPAGYGKTVALCHWVDEQLNSPTYGERNYQVLFLSGKVLNALPGDVGITEWMLGLMGLPNGKKTDALCNWSGKENFYLIIDDFDALCTKQTQADLLFDLLLDLITIHREHVNFKVILTMRSPSWAGYQRRLSLDDKLQDWFLGFMTDDNSYNNMQLFDSSEIKQLSANLNKNLHLPDQLQPEVISLFSYPLFFQYYYQKYKERFCLTHLDHFGIYEVVSAYCMDKVYASKYVTENVLLIKLLLTKGKYAKGQFRTDKLLVYEDLKLYKEAYQNLLAIGFLKETNLGEGFVYCEFVEFAHQRFFTNAQAKKLIYENGGLFDKELCNKLMNEVAADDRLQVLKWCIFSAVKTGSYAFLSLVNNVELPTPHKAILISFLSDLIERNFLLPPDVQLKDFIFDNQHEDLFYYFFGIEFISPEYQKALKGLLKLDLNDTTKIWIHVCLAIIAISQLRCDEVEQHIAELHEFGSEQFSCFVINPLYCIETIYYYFKYGVIKTEALQQITHFCFHPHKAEQTIGSNNILYLLAVATLAIANNKRKSIRFVNILRQLPDSKIQACPNYQFFLDVTLADAYLGSGSKNEALNLYGKLIKDYKEHFKRYTPYMKICVDFASAQMLHSTGKINEMETVIENIINCSEKGENWLMVLNVMSFYLSSGQVNKNDSLYKTVYIKFIKKIRACGFDHQKILFYNLVTN